MDFGTIAQWVSVAVALGAVVHTIISTRSRATKEAVDKLEGRLRANEHEITRIRSDIDHLPSKDAVVNIMLSLAELKGQVAALDERLKPVSAMSSRMQDFLMTEAAK